MPPPLGGGGEHTHQRRNVYGVAVRLSGANINRDTVGNVAKAGFEILAVDSHMDGLLKLIEARKGA